MRIEIDPNLERTLDQIKAKDGLNLSYNRGHAETVRFLAEYYRIHQNINSLVKQFETEQRTFMEGLDGAVLASLERVFPRAIARALANILTATTEPQPPTNPASAQPKTGR